MLAERAAAEGGEADRQPGPAAVSEREFRVRGKLQDDHNNLNLRLRICQPGGMSPVFCVNAAVCTFPAMTHYVRTQGHVCVHVAPAKTVEFDFDLGADTAMSVATEMVNELSLSHDDARSIAMAIGEEIKQLTGKLVEFQRDDNESLLSSDSAEVLHAAHAAPVQDGGDGAAAMDVESVAALHQRAQAQLLHHTNGRRLPSALGKPHDRHTNPRIQHVHFHEGHGCPPLPAPSEYSAASFTAAPARLAVEASSAPGASPMDTSDQHGHSMSDSEATAAAMVAARLRGAGSAEQLAALQRNDSMQTIKASGEMAPLADDGAEQNSLVGIKRSGSGILSPSKDGQKLSLKCGPAQSAYA